jgi:ADP-ribose pyrophosphatase YjhB (NUDIX family)
MNLFINDIPVKILKVGEAPEKGEVNYTLDAATELITKAKLINHVWVNHASIAVLDDILELINTKVPTDLLSLYISVDAYDAVKLFFRKKYKIVKAAGGLVKKKDKFLMIYRLKKWDLPKGKKETGENYRRTAEREISEECSVESRVGKKICTTWHTYTMNKSSMLKKTRWYLMECVDDSTLSPQREEDIEDIRWMNQKEVYHALQNSYRSIRFVFEEYYKRKDRAILK